MAYCPNISDEQVVKEFNSIVTHFGGLPLSIEELKNPELRDKREGINRTSMESAYYLWNKYAGNLVAIQNDDNYIKNVNYQLKAVNILLSDKAKQIFTKGEKAKWDLNKILTELAIPKEQKQLLLDLGITDREQLALELTSKYGYSVEINTAKEQTIPNKEEWINKVIEERGTTKEKALKEWEELNYRNTQYYSNLTVPGGTNYTENKIETPAIVPSIQGHAAWVKSDGTDNGIGWFRSDDKVVEGTQSKLTKEEALQRAIEDDSFLPFDTDNIGGIPTKTRRILELQSDLFQKSEKEIFSLSKYYSDYYKIPEFYTINGRFWHDIKTDTYYKGKNTVISKEEFENAFKDRALERVQELKEFYNIVTISKIDNNEYEIKTREIKNTIKSKLNIKDIDFRIKNIKKELSYSKEYVKDNFKDIYEVLDYSFNEFYSKRIQELNDRLDKEENLKSNYILEENQNQFLQLLNKDNNWVTFFIKSIIQDSAKKGYEKVLFPKGETAAKIEGHETLANEIRRIDKEIASFKEDKGGTIILGNPNTFEDKTLIFKDNQEKDKFIFENKSIGYTDIIKIIYNQKTTLEQLQQKKQELKSQGIEKLKPIEAFYEIRVGKILEKQFGKDNVKTITDEYGNQWREITIEDVDVETISLFPGTISSSIEERSSKYLIKELGAIKQESLTNSIARTITKRIVSAPDTNINTIRNTTLKEFKDRFERFKSEIESSTHPQKDKVLNELIYPILNNFETISRVVNIKVQKINNLIGEVNDDIDIELTEIQENDKVFNSKSSYEEKLSLSAEVKRLFADIDSPNKNILGEQDVMDYNVVDNVVKSIVAGLEPDFTIMMDALLENVVAHPWLKQLVDKLKNSDKRVQNLFVTEMNMHYIEHYMVLWQKDKSGFRMNLELANEGAITDIIFKDWYNNLALSTSVDDNGFLTNREELLSKYSELSKKVTNPIEVRNWLRDVGVIIEDKLWQNIVDGKYIIGKNPVTLQQFVTAGPMKYINNNIKNIGTKSLMEFNILNETSVKTLAKHQSKYIGQYASNSHRAGNKTVYSYGKNKYLVDYVRDLRRTSLAEDILKSGGVFNENSKILNSFKNKNEIFTSNFRIATASLQPIKKHGAQNKDNMELHNLNVDEYEMYTIGGLNSAIEDVSGNNARVGMFNFLTTADKTTSMLVRMVTEDITLTQEGKLSQRSIEKIYDQLVLPEIRRIKQWENMRTSGKMFPNKEIEVGGHMFLLLPSLNNLAGMWNPDGTININVEGPEMRASIMSEIREVVDKLVSDKLDLWQKYNFYSINDNGKVTLNLLDPKILSERGILRGVNENSIHEAMATDMVFQYLIANANFYTGIVGDPANFFKSSTFKSTVRNLKDSGVITDLQTKDIALVWSKFTPEQRIKTVEEAYDNTGKRLAMLIAPGKSTADNDGEIKYIFVNDKKVESLAIDQYKAILGEAAKEYTAEGVLEEGTNAQEFTTFLEDMFITFRNGLISEGLYNEVKRIVERELSKETPNHYYFSNLKKELPAKELEEFNKLVLQVQKPVYTWFEYKNGMGITPMYIKTSSYPLLPELTIGKEIDKMRIMMEKNGIQRLAFPSGTKLGMPKNPLTLWNEDGTIKDNLTQEEILGAIKILPRKGFRLQQDVPYEPLKDFINRVSQADKNLLINMLYISGFEYNGKTYSGAELQKEYEKNYGELYKLGYDNLVKELNIKFDANGNIESLDRSKLKTILLEEAIKRGYALNDIEALDLDESLDYIAFMPSSSKYEALLNAIVKNRILQMKFKGKSFVLSTEEGYQQDTTKAWEDIEDKEGIIYTDKWNGTLDPGHFTDINGKRLTGEELTKAFKEGTVIVKRPAQVLIPWKFQWKGELLHIEDFINPETGRIDSSKLPDELLEIFGMRIPNQGPNSQSWIEIAGFMPKKNGDVIVATRDYLAQMGSDFDVDKLYSYMYNYYFNGTALEKIKFNTKEEIMKLQNDTLEALAFQLDDGKAKVLDAQARYLENVDKVWNQALQNKQLDIHIAIHKNTNILVQKQILEPLGFWKFKSIADNVMAAREYNPKFTAMSDAYQRFKRLNAAAGKTLVGDFANGLMFVSVAQGRNLGFYNKMNGKNVTFRFGNNWSNGDLSNPLTIGTINKLVNAISTKTKESKKDISAKIDTYLPNILEYLDVKDIVFRSEVMNGLLSSAVDNEKEQILDKLFMNSATSKYTKLLASLGYEEEVAYFTKQPIVVDYFNEIKRLRSSLGDFTPNASDLAKQFVLNKYKVQDYSADLYKEKYSEGKGLTVKNMADSILNPPSDFNYIQRAVFEQLEYLEKYANDLQALQSAINTDSKGLDKGLLETISKEDAVDRIYLNSIRNASSVLDGTVNGFATNYGLRFNNKLWSNLFPYRQQGIQYMFESIEKILGKEEVGVQGKAALKSKIWKQFKSYLFTVKELGLYDGDINTERERLFMDRGGNKSLASKVKELKNLPKFSNHPFISKLNPEINRGNKPSIIKMDAGFDQVGELLTVQGATELYVNDRFIPEINMTTRELFVDLVRAAYLSGGIQEAVQYIKFMPVSYLYSTGFTENLSNKVRTKFFEDTEKLGIPHQNMPYWMLPNFLVQYIQHDSSGIANLGENYADNINITKVSKELSSNIKIQEFSLKNDGYYVDRDNEQVPPEFLVIPSIRERGLKSDVLFIHQGNFDNKGYPIYHRIPNYGIFAFNEFSYDGELYLSKINSYNTGGYTFNLPVIEHPNEIGYSDNYTNIETERTTIDILEIPKSGNVNDISIILDNIMLHTNDTFYQELAKEYSSNIDKLSEVTITYGEHGTEFAGRFFNNKITINSEHEQNGTIDGISETVLHEVTHGFVDSVVDTPLSKLSPDAKLAVADLNRLLSIYRSRVIKDLGKDKYDEIFTKLKTRKYDLIKDNSEAMRVYATTNIKEFVAMAMSNELVQKDLNNISDPEFKERKLLDKFVDIVRRLLNSLGFDVNKGSVLSAAVQDVVVIIKSNNFYSEKDFLVKKQIKKGLTIGNKYYTIKDLEQLKTVFVTSKDYAPIKEANRVANKFSNRGIEGEIKDYINSTELTNTELKWIDSNKEEFINLWKSYNEYENKPGFYEWFGNKNLTFDNFIDFLLEKEKVFVYEDSRQLSLFEEGETIESLETSSDIYNKLGNKTQSENVVIDGVAGRKPAVENAISENIKNFANSIIPNWINNKQNEIALAAEFKSLQLLSRNESSIQDRIKFGKEAEKLIKEGLKGKNPFEGVTFESQIPNMLYAVISGKLAEDNISEADMYNNIFNQSSKPIVAYRTRGNNFLEALEKDNAIGNPWGPHGIYKTSDDGTAVKEFIAWMIGEKHTDKLQDYRQSIIDKIPELKGKTIIYYKDLGRPSHATALDYLINKYNWNNTLITRESFEGEVIETLFPGNTKNEMNSILSKHNELNRDGSRKLMVADKNGELINYKRMLKRAQAINKENYSYKAVVAETTGEEVTIRSGRLYYYIKLIPREMSIKQKMNSISQEEIFDRMKKCM